MNTLKWMGLDIDPMKINESLITKPGIQQVDTKFNESANESKIEILYPKIEAIHEGRTRNFNRYPGEKLKGDASLRSGVYSWTAPYPKPVIFNHDTDTECVGRVMSASYSEVTTAGRPGIILVPKITHEKTIRDILAGQLLTVSIGATTNAAVCSCCGTDIINEGWCGHMRGEEYDGQVCEWICGDLYFDEVSWVNVPADEDAMVIATGASEQTAPIIAGAETAESTELQQDKVVVKNKAVEQKEEEGEVLPTKEELELALAKAQEELNKVLAQEAQEQEEQQEEDETSEGEEQEEQQEGEESSEEQQEEGQENAEENEVEEAKENEAETSELQAALDQANEELEEAKRSVEELTEANKELAKEYQQSMVEFLVELRMLTNKESDKEEATNKFASRSIESLKDSMSDILADNPTVSTQVTRTVERVVKPAGSKATESKQVTKESTKVTSNEDALKALLVGGFGR